MTRATILVVVFAGEKTWAAPRRYTTSVREQPESRHLPAAPIPDAAAVDKEEQSNRFLLPDKQISLEGTEPLLLFGFNDIYLRKVEAAFPETQITARGNRIKLSGEEKKLETIERILSELILILNRNGNLTENDVETVLALYGTGNGAVAEDTDTRDVVLFTPNGGVVRAKTQNQGRLVAAARTNDLLFAIGPAGTGKTYTAVALAVAALILSVVRAGELWGLIVCHHRTARPVPYPIRASCTAPCSA